MNFKLTASIMCANYGNLEQEVKALDNAGIDSFHIDIICCLTRRFTGRFLGISCL